MRHLHAVDARPAAQLPSGEWARLILKLRWMGFEDEARSLELALGKVAQSPSGDWAKLIKLRWIGLEDEAHLLELAMSKLPAEKRGSVLVGPLSTD